MVNFYAATANPVTVLIAEDEQGRGIVGVIDGFRSKGIETEGDVKEEKSFCDTSDINYEYVHKII